MSGKGDKYRPVDRKQYEKNYDAIFKAINRMSTKIDKVLRKGTNDKNKNNS